jgi:FkbM family methyltransferase
MNLSKLSANWTLTARFCGGLGSRLLYLYCLYTRTAPWTHAVTLHLRTGGGEAFPVVLRNNRSDLAMAREVFLERCYDVALAEPPRRILDLGGNIGLATAYFARRWPGAAIAVVEPMPGNLALLRRNLAALAPAARLFEGAISPEPGTIRMEQSAIDSEHRVAADGTGGAVEVAAHSVGSLMEAMGWDAVDLVKMDIEGFENVLLREKADWVDRVRAMVLEIHPPLDEAGLRAWAAGVGFGVRPIAPEVYLLTR